MISIILYLTILAFCKTNGNNLTNHEENPSIQEVDTDWKTIYVNLFRGKRLRMLYRLQGYRGHSNSPVPLFLGNKNIDVYIKCFD